MTSAASNRHAKTTSLLQKVQRVALYAGVVVGAILGIPPFVTGADSLLGANIERFLQVLFLVPFSTGMIKFCIIAGLALGGYGIWQRSLETFKKFIAIFLLALFAYYIFGMSSQAIAAFLLRATCPFIGAMIWTLINVLQIKMLTLKNDDGAMKKLVGKMRNVDKSAGQDPDLTPLQAAMIRGLSRDRVSESLAFFMTAGAISYVIEIAVNLIYSDNINIDWGTLLRPGGLAAIGFSLVFSLLTLLLTVGSIEYCVTSLQRADDLRDAIES